MILPKSITGKKITILGFGLSGQAAARLAKKMGARVNTLDHAPAQRFSPTILTEFSALGIACHFGGMASEILSASDIVILSPGFPLEHPDLQVIRDQKIPVIGELEFGYQLMDFMPKRKIVAITGTNGKTTTTALVAHILKQTGRAVFLGGNIGFPLCGMVLDEKNGTGFHEVVVLELSSFQLETIQAFSPDVVVILNVAPDHMNRYEKYEDYIAAKARIFENLTVSGRLFINDADKDSRPFATGAKAKKLCCEFFPRILAMKEAQAIVNDLVVQKKLPGLHNRENLAAAFSVVRHLGVPWSEIERAVRSFKSQAYRLQYLGRVRGVHIYNDSKATNVHSALAALNAMHTPFVWIAGGYEAGEDFLPFKRTVMDLKAKGPELKKVFLLGPSAKKIQAVLGNWVPNQLCENLEEALRLALENTKDGETLVFSPSCKSFDRYRDYKERGEHFSALVSMQGDFEPVKGSGN